MHKLNLLFFIFIGFLSCGPTEPQQVNSTEWSRTDTVAYQIVQLHRTLKACADHPSFNCPEATVRFVQLKAPLPSSIDSAAINALIRRTLSGGKSVSGYLESFVKDYEMILEEEPDLVRGQTAWQLKVNQSVLCNTTDLFTISSYNYLFTGGAHGNFSTTFLNIDLKNNRLLSLGDILSGEFEEILTDVGERYFRAQNKIPMDQSLNSTGFWFEDEQFYLPSNYAFTPSGILFVFGTYEITSFADGEPQVLVPYSAVSGLLKKGHLLPYQS